MRGMIIGRFQPFHNGHLKMIKHILERVDELIIVIAASQKSYKPDNPFTAGERYEMIHQSLIDELQDITRVIIIPANDINDYDLWVYHITRLVPEYDVVFANNPLTQLLFSHAGKKVETPPHYERKKLSGTNIRKMILEKDNEWKKLVPKKVVKTIEKMKGEKRILDINSNDKK